MSYNVVFHFDYDPKAFGIACSNIKNYYAYFTENKPEVVLVVNGPGVQLLARDGEHAGQISEVSQLGAAVKVCNNALNAFNLTPDQICPECEVVSAGVVEIVELQNKGFKYLKP